VYFYFTSDEINC